MLNKKESTEERMRRREELKLIKKFIKENGVTKLAPDARIEMNNISVWRKNTRKKEKSS